MSQQRRVAIVTDSTSDLAPELRQERGIAMVPLNVHFGDEVFVDQITISTDEFMAKMASSENLPTTSQPSVGQFEDAFKAAAAEHGVAEIVCITISSKLSGTFQSASIAAQNLTGTLKVEVVDSFSASYGCGYQVLRAAELADEGMNASEIAQVLTNEITRYQLIFFVDTLEHLRRGGRIGKAAQLVGTLLQLKPLLRVDEGAVVPFERTRTRSKAIKALEAYAAETGGADEIMVMYNTTPEEASRLATAVTPYSSGESVGLFKVGPVIATHVGPGVLGLVIKERLPA